MAFTNWDNDFLELPSDTLENPGYWPSRVRDFKEGIQTILNHEHYFGVSGEPLTYQSEHRSGSAKAYSQAAEPTTKPDGSDLTAIDNGRLWHDPDDDSLLVYQNDDNKFVHLFEADSITPLDPAETLTSIQDKLDALAYQIKAITGEDAWSTAPDDDVATMSAAIATNAADIATNADDIDTLEATAIATGDSPTFTNVTHTGYIIPRSDPRSESLTIAYPSGTTDFTTKGLYAAVYLKYVKAGSSAEDATVVLQQYTTDGWQTLLSISESDNGTYYSSILPLMYCNGSSSDTNGALKVVTSRLGINDHVYLNTQRI